jgi:hypothetical protein
VGAGVVTREFEVGGFDYLVFEALYNELYEGPDNFEGFSGGSLWQVLVKHDGTWKITDSLLSAVAFFQSKKKSNKERLIREIICHGSRSIYKDLIDRVRSQLPA